MTSRSSHKSPGMSRYHALVGADRSRESPLRSSKHMASHQAPSRNNPLPADQVSRRSNNQRTDAGGRTVVSSSLNDDSKLDAQAFA